MANAKAGDLWVTLQTHQNIVAVASLKEIAGIIIIGGREPEKATLAKAEEEKIPISARPAPRRARNAPRSRTRPGQWRA